MAVVSVALLQSTSQLAVFDLWRLKNQCSPSRWRWTQRQCPPSSEDEDETGGEAAAAQTEDAFAAAQEEAEEEADFVARVQAEEARAEAARMEADAAECGYDGD